MLKTEVLHSPPISQLPKNILKAPAHNPTDPSAYLAYEALPNPSPAHPLRRPDQRFLDSEVFTNKFASHLSGPMEKVTRRSMKRWAGWFLALALLLLLSTFTLVCPLTIPYLTFPSCRIRPRSYGAWRNMERLQPQREWRACHSDREDWPSRRCHLCDNNAPGRTTYQVLHFGAALTIVIVARP